MKILFLVHRIPFPPNKGDKIRSFNEIKYLSKKHEIYLGTIFDQPSDGSYLENLNNYCKEVYAVYYNKKLKLLKNMFFMRSFTVASFYDKRLQTYVDHVLSNNNIDVILCFCSSMAEYVFRTILFKRNKLNNVKLIMDFVDLDSDKWLQYAEYSNFPLSSLYRLENIRLFHYEKKIINAFNNSIFVSNREVNILKKLYSGRKDVHVVPNGVNTDYFYLNKSKTINYNNNQNPILVFTGMMDYFANEDGVIWFSKYIFPRIRDAFPKVEFFIVGNNPTNKVWALSEIDGITVTGYVDDIRPYYWMADICVMPLRIARGLQNKVLEAMATGNAVVATPNASDGIQCHNGEDILIADDEIKFSEEVISLLKNDARREQIGKKAFENISRNYSWEENMNKLENLLA